ncbi:succinylglutamate desuccinylase [Pseudoduganella albidiflava]|uniref:Succinylglutamate desuccinylase n=1 Tax=Pseudoduganella albidiflava TaxID=321983 RepID=A0A411WSC8_9BURK|nr:succinylglutamate desuccinylase [Pseudoduganella albidiflava]QBH99396.1 succinylglutamate desuccinylase [Pseudoduganella albidiflava]GGY44508.1 succinylglutamate desuccinylase [Pseudoduganella albidiflava]
MNETLQDGLPPPVRALAEADFSAVAQAFGGAGFSVAEPADGILTIRRPGSGRPAVLLSVGVHGDETGPIELTAYLLDALAREPAALAVDLMVCVGSIGAIRAGKRFIDADLNRMFRAERGSLAGTAEAARADEMIAATAAFFADAGAERWHLDLHTAIRASHYPTFAIVPELIEETARERLIGWLGEAGIGAVILNRETAGTYSYHTAEHHGAAGSTVELGRIGTLGRNDLAQFAAASAALDRLLRGKPPAQAPLAVPHLFRVAQNIIKLSDRFTMAFGKETQNFTPLRQGDEIARDGDTVYTVQHDEEFVVFPNPDVRIGLRAGMMVVRIG